MKIREYNDRFWESKAWSGAAMPYGEGLLRWMKSSLEDRTPIGTIVDFGCGDGFFTRALTRHARRVIGVDVAARQLERNRAQMPEIEFVEHDLGDRMPFPDDSVDAVWCAEVLSQLLRPRFAAEEAWRILRPGGIFVATVPYHGLLKNLLIAAFKWEHHFDPDAAWIRFFTVRSLGAMLTAAGFRNLVFGHCGMGAPLRDFVVPCRLLVRAEKPRKRRSAG